MRHDPDWESGAVGKGRGSGHGSEEGRNELELVGASEQIAQRPPLAQRDPDAPSVLRPVVE